jgi:hypothetical protein
MTFSRVSYFDHCHSLKFEENPNYANIIEAAVGEGRVDGRYEV